MKWCYIGKRRLEKAISIYQKTYPGGSNDTFHITWHPYYLNYNPHPYSVEKTDLMNTKLSGMTPEQRDSLVRRMNQIGLSVGIIFKGGGKIGPTRQAHRLVHYCQMNAISTDIRDALVDAIFSAYHERELDISSADVLRSIAVEVGLDGEKVDEWLSLDVQENNVDDLAEKNKVAVASTGVPTFKIQDSHRVDGAQDSAEFIEAFVKVKES